MNELHIYRRLDDPLDVLEVGAGGVEHGGEEGDVEQLEVDPLPVARPDSLLGLARALVISAHVKLVKGSAPWNITEWPICFGKEIC